ncbi:trihydroxytoluene oxygenase [Aspergillus thermomutatus]|uniref:VOC domain-containing protein n=1 Tax=Aspergillus thermomutatus TaxID=41047 RepID=A0A397GV01_ASPTH|nr:uncharacterized protein CDV56_103300 [Aspergillus thermomutatus]RHZ54842.1 hypothetical protein CDV56_103300 [Aspergillus thermomutatus]
MSLSGKVALVTGGSKGIGKAAALRLAQEGASVAVGYYSDAAGAQEIVDRVGSDRAIAIKIHAGKVPEITSFVEQAVEKFGKIDLVVAAAGMMTLSTLETNTEEQFDELFALNVKGPMFLVQKAAPHMAPGSHVILFSSTLTVVSTVMPNYLNYVSSKGAVEQMTRVLSKDLGRKGIAVNCIAPGPTHSELFDRVQTEQSLNFLRSANPNGRIGEPEDIAGSIVFLCSNDSRWVMGQTLRPETSQAESQPCHGASVPDVVAIGEEQESLAKWKEQCGIKTEKQIRLVKLAHMRYQHPDLDAITVFLQDFGMQVAKKTDEEVWYRGYGTDPYVYYARKGPKDFLGGTFEVESYRDLERAADLPTGSTIQELKDAPGGGFMVTVKDPEGFPINLIYGQTPAAPGEYPSKLVVNYESDKPRVRHFQRFVPGPAAVHKLGHFGLCVQNFREMVTFYTTTFNLVPSDFLYVEKDKQKKPVALFAHIDRGAEYVDHHSFFMSMNPTSHVHHCSFEVHDFDTQNLGHQWLAKKGFEPVWGVGRHILGSQIFDYWWDTTGNMIEHYADGDLVNEETPIGYGPAGDESLAVWGPEVPRSFLQ